MVTLSVLDQVPVFEGSDAATAIQESLDLAIAVERLGYQRFWIAEHHGTRTLACPSPELLTAIVAAHTRTIRVGPGCVVLPHYSPLKVAESFCLLQTLFPNRIDLGIGRGPGTDPQVSKVLNPSVSVSTKQYAEQVEELVNFLTQNFAENHPYKYIPVIPDGTSVSELWLLGSSLNGAQLAASSGLSFCLAQFINNRTHPEITEAYRRDFRPSSLLSRPRVSLAVRVLCAESAEEAQQLALSFWATCLRSRKHSPHLTTGVSPLVPSLETALHYHYTNQDYAYMHDNQLMMISSNPIQVKEHLMQLVEIYGVDELVILTICPTYQARLRSFQLLARAFDLTPATDPDDESVQQSVSTFGK